VRAKPLRATPFAASPAQNTTTAECVFRIIVTGRFGSVTAEFGNVTGHFGDVTDGVFAPA
jgi:hypothetical protein